MNNNHSMKKYTYNEILYHGLRIVCCSKEKKLNWAWKIHKDLSLEYEFSFKEKGLSSGGGEI